MFLGHAFQETLVKHGIHKAGSTVKNPQSNAVCERLHQSIANSLRALNCASPPKTDVEARTRVDSALQTATHGARTALHSTLKASPDSMAFHRDMILNIPFIVDFELLMQRRQLLIDGNLAKTNAKRISFDCQPAQRALKIVPSFNKLDLQAAGPCDIERIHMNETVVLRLNDQVTERTNIRRIEPHCEQKVFTVVSFCSNLHV